MSVRPHLTFFTPFSLQGNNFELGAVTVDPQTSSYDPHPLIEYLAALKLPYFYEEQGMVCFVQLCVVLYMILVCVHTRSTLMRSILTRATLHEVNCH